MYFSAVYTNFALIIIRYMAKNVSWSDDYWLLLMQLYLRKPVGVKALYSRGLVQLALELHIEPVSYTHLTLPTILLV